MERFAASPTFKRTAVRHDESVGATLLAARQMEGKAISTYAKTLAIPARYLEALEAENVNVLPGLVYELHFIARYAEALGLDARPLMEHWRSQRIVVAPEKTPFVRRVHWRDLWIGPVALRRFGAALMVLTLAAYLGGRLVSMVQPPDLTVTAPADDVATVNRTVVVTGNTEASSHVTINGQPIPVEPNGTFAVPVTLETGTNTIQVASAKRYSRPATVERRVFVTTTDVVAVR